MRFTRDKKGEEAVFLLKEKTDAVLDSLEGLTELKVSPAGIGKLVLAGRSATLDLSALVALIYGISDPWLAIPCAPPEGDTDSGGPWVYVSPNSFILGYDKEANVSYAPTDYLPTTGLGVAHAFQITDAPPYHIWAEVNVSKLASIPIAQPPVTIKSGQKWDFDDFSRFPQRTYFNTNDGSPLGTLSTTPTDNYQTKLIVPIAYTVKGSSDSVGVGKFCGRQIGDDVYLVQQLTTHLILTSFCAGGATSFDIQPWFGPQPSAT
jgi:hypothetical protein